MEQALIVVIKLSDGHWGNETDDALIYSLEEELMDRINNSGFGHYDGHEFGGGYCSLFMYCHNVDKLYELTIPILKQFYIPRKSFIVKQLGESREERVNLPFSVS